MKKSMVIVLALVFVLSIAATAFAAPANPFVDVPAKHWAYGAVSKLAKAGIVDGYGDGTFRGDKTMTRYEMAQIVAKAMAKSDKADAELKALIDKLAVEFAAELNNLGVRVAKLEKNASTIKFTGDARIRYQKNHDGSANNVSGAQANDRFQERVRLNLSATVADNVAFNGRLVAQNRTSDSVVGQNDELEFDQAYFTFKNVMPLSNLSVGRQGVAVSNGLLMDANYFDGAKITFGNELKGFFAYGDARYAPGPGVNAANSGVEKAISVVGLQYAPNKDLTLYGAYAKDNSVTQAFIPLKNWDFGLTANLSPDFTFKGEYTKNSHSDLNGINDKSAYWVQLGYKGADKSKVGSWGLFVNYRKVGLASIDTSLTMLDFAPVIVTDVPASFKGLGYGFDYTIAKNTVFKLSFEDLKGFGLYQGADWGLITYAQVNFSF